MDRAELEHLDRDALISRAEANGVVRARILTRPELIDELLVRAAGDVDRARKARGFFGRARDLLARVIERGLHLPDAADKLRTLSIAPPPSRGAAAPLPTVTLAGIYAAQGHRDRALETLREVLVREPDHDDAKVLLERLSDAAYELPKPPLPPEDDEAEARARANAEAEARAEAEADARAEAEAASVVHRARAKVADVDECVALPVDAKTTFVAWEVREATRAARKGSDVSLRVIAVVPTWDGPRAIVRDAPVSGAAGDELFRDLPEGAVVRAAIGWRSGDAFIPIASSPALEVANESIPGELARWTPRGLVAIGIDDVDAAAIARARARLSEMPG
jgi:hypothetical protein